MGYYVYINYSKGNNYKGDENGEDNKDNKSNQEEGTKEDNSNNEDYEPLIQSK